MNSTFEQWRSLLPAGHAPAWLEDFAANAERPQDVLDELLRRQADLGRLQPMEPEVLLLDWYDRLGRAPDFRQRLDAALAAWIAEQWGILKLDAGDLRRRSDRWDAALTVVSVTPALDRAVAETVRHFGEAHEFLGPMSQSPSSDPLGVFLSIVARHQKSRELESFWWRMLGLPPEVPYYHAVYAMSGLRGLPPAEPGTGGGFRKDVVQGLLRLAAAFLRLGRDGILAPNFAEEEFLRVGRITLAAYPFLKRWREALSLELDPVSPVTELLEKLLPGVSEPPSIEAIQAAAIQPDDEWAERAQNLSRLLDADGLVLLETLGANIATDNSPIAQLAVSLDRPYGDLEASLAEMERQYQELHRSFTENRIADLTAFAENIKAKHRASLDVAAAQAVAKVNEAISATQKTTLRKLSTALDCASTHAELNWVLTDEFPAALAEAQRDLRGPLERRMKKLSKAAIQEAEAFESQFSELYRSLASFGGRKNLEKQDPFAPVWTAADWAGEAGQVASIAAAAENASNARTGSAMIVGAVVGLSLGPFGPSLGGIVGDYLGSIIIVPTPDQRRLELSAEIAKQLKKIFGEAKSAMSSELAELHRDLEHRLDELVDRYVDRYDGLVQKMLAEDEKKALALAARRRQAENDVA